MWIVYAFLSAITAALVAIFAKLGLRDIDPTLATTLRSIIMALFLLAGCAAGSSGGYESPYDQQPYFHQPFSSPPWYDTGAIPPLPVNPEAG